jgi:hypothetical protein
MLPSDFFRRNVVLSLPEDAIGIRRRDVIGPDNMIREPHGVTEKGRLPTVAKVCYRLLSSQ